MKKNLILTSFAAIVATGAANAATDVTFAGDYQLGNGSSANVGTALNGSTYTYTYTKSDNSTATVAQNIDPDLHFFTYTDKNDDPANLYVGGVNLTAADFDGATAADGTSVISHQTIAANETISRNNYEYVDGKGDTVTLGESARSFTETVALNSTYSTVASVDVTDGSAAPVLDGAIYVWTDPDTNAVYHLSNDGTKLVDALNMEQTPTSGSAQETAFNEMVAAFAADSAAITAAKTAVDGYATAEATAFAAADGVYTTDAGTITALTSNYGTYTAATTLLGQAQTAQAARQADFAADQALETAAAGLYNTPIETVQAATLQDAKDYADGLAANYDAVGTSAAETTRATAQEATLQANIDAEATARATADTTLQANIDAEATARAAADTTLQANIDAEATARATADTTLQNNIDNEVARATAQEAAIRGEFAAADAQTLANANAYTDSKVNTLEKNISGGVAAATALSAVNVGNVAKGEVSVGGGYGYYNSQSAVAFGAAMGLSDNWSVNAGAGIASGDKTQFSIRAGTNYKFKLF